MTDAIPSPRMRQSKQRSRPKQQRDPVLLATWSSAQAEAQAMSDNGIPPGHPVSDVRWVPIAQVRANDYNPNLVAPVELELLRISIIADGYTQPIVTVRDEQEIEHIEGEESREIYVIVDGFHRYYCARRYEDVRQKTNDMLPIVTLDETGLPDRMASTVRHNRARGKHSIGGMGKLVMEMVELGMSDQEVCRELGLSADELIRLKHVTGVAKLFEDGEYRRAWKTKRQAYLRRQWEQEHGPINAPPSV